MASVSSVFNIFAKSPLKSMQQHMQVCYDCATMLTAFFKEVNTENWTSAEEVYKKIVDLEHQADSIKQKLRLSLPQSLFLPVARTDLIQMIRMQDRIANLTKDIAGLILGREMPFPPQMQILYLNFLHACIKTVAQACTAIDELDELLETGFKGVEAKIVEKMIIELDECEHITDEMQVEVRRSLFEVEDTISPIDAMFLYKIIDWTGDLADHSQTVGGQLQLLLAR